MAIPTFESRQATKQSDFLSGDTQHFRSSGKLLNSDKDMNTSAVTLLALITEYLQGRDCPAFRDANKMTKIPRSRW